MRREEVCLVAPSVDSPFTVAPRNHSAMPAKRGNGRKQITLDLTPAQIQWLDLQAAPLMSRSAFVRQLIAQAMERQDNS